jgi:hypothetical protein
LNIEKFIVYLHHNFNQSKMIEEKKLLSVAQFAARYKNRKGVQGVTTAYIYQLIQEKKLTVKEIAGKNFIHEKFLN